MILYGGFLLKIGSLGKLMVLGCPIFQTHANKESPRPFNDIQLTDGNKMMRDIEASKRTVWMIQNRRFPASMEDKHPKLLAVSSPDGAQMGDAEDPVSAEVVQSESAPWPQHPRCGQKCDAEAPSVRFPASVLYWKNGPSIDIYSICRWFTPIIRSDFPRYQELSWQRLSPFWVFGCKEALDALSAWSSSAASRTQLLVILEKPPGVTRKHCIHWSPVRRISYLWPRSMDEETDRLTSLEHQVTFHLTNRLDFYLTFFSDMWSGMISDMVSDILPTVTYYPAFYLAYFLTCYLTFNLTFYLAFNHDLTFYLA